jgi:hypothetical protein
MSNGAKYALRMNSTEGDWTEHWWMLRPSFLGAICSN